MQQATVYYTTELGVIPLVDSGERGLAPRRTLSYGIVGGGTPRCAARSPAYRGREETVT